MIEYEQCIFATSKAGHDKCKLSVIIKEDDEYVYLVDGKSKRLSTPKKKNKKHIQRINYIDDELTTKLNSKHKLIDEDIKRAIKVYGLKNRKSQ